MIAEYQLSAPFGGRVFLPPFATSSELRKQKILNDTREQNKKQSAYAILW